MTDFGLEAPSGRPGDCVPSPDAAKNFELPLMLVDELPGWVRLDALYRALNDAYHPQNPIPDHPADFVERWASESEHWAPEPPSATGACPSCGETGADAQIEGRCGDPYHEPFVDELIEAEG